MQYPCFSSMQCSTSRSCLIQVCDHQNLLPLTVALWQTLRWSTRLRFYLLSTRSWNPRTASFSSAFKSIRSSNSAIWFCRGFANLFLARHTFQSFEDCGMVHDVQKLWFQLSCLSEGKEDLLLLDLQALCRAVNMVEEAMALIKHCSIGVHIWMMNGATLLILYRNFSIHSYLRRVSFHSFHKLFRILWLRGPPIKYLNLQNLTSWTRWRQSRNPLVTDLLTAYCTFIH